MTQVLDKPLYRAFISYSHNDKAVASWLHRSLEHYRIPKKLIGLETPLGPVPKRLLPIFRDQDELPASGNLGQELQNALSQSLFLVVICSPTSARSKWVNEEIRQFKAIHGSNRVLALIVDGQPNPPTDLASQECFAPALKVEVDANGELSDIPCEPIAADLRSDGDGKRMAKLKLVSGLTGLRLDDLVQREAARRVKALVQVTTMSTIAAIFAVGLALYANEKRMEADAQRAVAEQESATSQAVSNFLVNSFAMADSSQENPENITAKEILIQGAQRLEDELDGQGIVQSRLSAVIALAFNNLGLYDEAITIVDRTTASTQLENPVAYLFKAEAMRRKGDLDVAMSIANHAQSLSTLKIDQFTDNGAKLRSDIASTLALIYYQLGQHEKGIEAYRKAIHELENSGNGDSLSVAKTLQNRALLLSDLGEFEQASLDLERAMRIALDKVGEKHYLVGQIALAQAQVNFLSGNLEAAQSQIEAALTNLRRILEEDNPSLADAYSMQGQILHAMGKLPEAEQALTHAVEVYTKAYQGRHYLSGIAEVYLGLIAGDQNNLPAALQHFAEAKLHYDESYGQIHANHGDLLVNQATVLAKFGELAKAKQDCQAGMVILDDTLGKDAPFTQQLQAVCDEIQSLEAEPNT